MTDSISSYLSLAQTYADLASSARDRGEPNVAYGHLGQLLILSRRLCAHVGAEAHDLGYSAAELDNAAQDPAGAIREDLEGVVGYDGRPFLLEF